MKICLYGASSNSIDKSYIEATEKLGEVIAENGHTLVFGGGAYGLMGAAARGMTRKNGEIIGISPEFFNVDGVLYDKCTEFIYTKTMRERKKLLEEKSDAFVVAPGGIGTFDEFFEIFALKQLGIHKKPIAVFNVNGYYDFLIAMLQNTANQGFMEKKCLEIAFFSDSQAEIIKYFENYNPEDYDFSVLRKVEN